jgi:glutamate racemase
LSTIGVFDSGIGGLSVLNEALNQSPGHHYLYIADSANTPYGEKSTQWVSDRSLLLCSWLVQKGCDAVVVACNTATAQAIAMIRERFSQVPIIGVEPGIKPASATSQQKIVGVLATQNTLNSDKFKLLLASLDDNCEFIQQAGHGLVPLIEHGTLNGPEIESLLQQYLGPMLDQGADTLVLGCTHYPFLQAAIEKMYGDRLQIVDTSHAVVRQLCRLIKDPESIQNGHVDVYSTQDGDALLGLAQKLLPHPYLRNATAHTVSI